MKRVALYTRVSTADGQTVENQERELRAVAERHGWEIAEVFADEGVSGAKARDQRPAMRRLMQAVSRREIDMVAAWSVCRLGRSLPDLVGFLAELRAKSVGLYLHQQNVDTSTPAGEAMFGMLGIFAQFERAMIQERVRAGLARARAQGRRLGRKPTPDATKAKVIALRLSGRTVVAIADELKIGIATAERVLAAHRKAQAAVAVQPVAPEAAE